MNAQATCEDGVSGVPTPCGQTPPVWVAVSLLFVSVAGRGAPAWEPGPGFRSAPLSFPDNTQPGFTQLPAAVTGVTFTNLLSDAAEAHNRLLEIGSGVALGDVDGDGWTDLYLCGLEGSNAIYRNLGNWRFEDITARAGVACPGQFSTGCVLVDLEGDGDLDLLVNSLGGGTRLFRNDGKGVFSEDRQSGLFPAFGATSMALADLDGDGDLDLYVTNYRTDTFLDQPEALSPKLRRQPDGSTSVEPKERFVILPAPTGPPLVVERGEPDVAYINRGGGHFAPVPWNLGVFRSAEGGRLASTPTDWGLAVLFRDLNGDRLPDLYVCNDFVYWPDRVWLNRDGRFFQPAPAHAFRTFSLASMAVDVADLNRDGVDDLFVSDMLNPRRQARAWQRPDTLDETVRWPKHDPDFIPEVPRNTLQLARGDGTYAEIAQLAGVAATDWTPAVAFLDVDLDGWEDLLLVTGNKHDVQDTDALGALGSRMRASTPAMRRQERAQLPPRKAPSLALRNRHDLTFEDASARWGFHAVGFAHGIALGDLDNDGDLDVVINAMNELARVYRNECPAPRVAVRLRGLAENTRGVGARIILRGGPVTQSQEIMAGGRFCSSDDPVRAFAAGAAARLELEVLWRSGRRTRVADVRPNRIYECVESEANAPPQSDPPPPAPLFEDVSVRLQQVQVDAPFDDFARQPLLPRRLSTLGPGVAWADLDGDGGDELIISGGKGGRCAIYRNDGHGQFTEWSDAPVPKVNSRDQTGVVVWHGADGRPRLIIGESNWEDGDPTTPPFRVLAIGPDKSGGARLLPSRHNLDSGTARPEPRPTGPEPRDRSAEVRAFSGEATAATGPLALGDLDGDGDLDLFVGGRALAGRYPMPADSWLFLNDDGVLRPAQRFPALGLVSGALFADLDGDGDPDLALACDWGPVRVFINDGGRLSERTDELGLARWKGWWNGIAAGDFDGDGRLDLVASNWGRNWRTDQPTGVRDPAPVQLVYGEFAGDGVLQTLLASWDPDLSKVTPWRERRAVVAAIPPVAARCPDHHRYGGASLAEVLGESAASATVLEAGLFDSTVFLNRGGGFEPHSLPVEAQFSPAFGIGVGDFDGDGAEDLFLAQNFFGVDVETSRQDAGTGLVLLGDGRGGFRALAPREAGFNIPGEQRGVAVADFDGDGRLDLVVGQQAGSTRLLRNTRGRSGVHVKLEGPPGNPTGVGAVVRLRWGGTHGPARAVQAGSGYWSQDSAQLVLAAPTAPTAVWIRWPQGREVEYPWPAGAREVTVSAEGLRPR